MPKIFVLSGPDVGQSFELQPAMLCGRAEDCGVRLHDASVSRHHARIEHQDNGWSIVDLGSRNGLFWNGQRVEHISLDDGREFTLGEVVLKFRDSVPASTTAASTRRPASDDIVLEGSWEDTAAPSASAVTAFAPKSAATPQPAPSKRAVEKLAAAGSAVRQPELAARGVLQYSKVESRAGVLQSDFEQQPGWIKALILFIVLVVFAGVAWMAFRMVVVLRGTTAAPTAIEGEGEGETR